MSVSLHVPPAQNRESPQLTNVGNPRNWRRLIRRIILTVVALGIWFWTQSLIAQRSRVCFRHWRRIAHLDGRPQLLFLSLAFCR